MQVNGQKLVVSAIRAVSSLRNSDPRFYKTCFFIVDSYMDMEQYDSAQIWLNKIHAVLPENDISIFGYFFSSRQAEVYYYNNLKQFGLRQGRKSQTIAQKLKDSLLLADSYNILGLFYMNSDSASKAVQFFRQGLTFAKQPPHPEPYLSLSDPHHLYGNIAEAYYNQQKYDSASCNFYLSLQKATEVKAQRGIAVAYSGLGDVYLALENMDSAINYYEKTIVTSLASSDIDVTLMGYKGLSKCYFNMGDSGAANQALAHGFELFGQNPNINRFYALRFLYNAIDIYKKNNNTDGLIRALELKSTVENANLIGNNEQIQTILNAGLANETKLLNIQIEEAKHKQKLANTRLMLSLAVLALIAIVFWIYRYYQRQKNTVALIRQRISQDLHDDIGASLSSLQIYGAIAELSLRDNTAKTTEMLQKIKAQTRDIMENMSDIVWSMKTNRTGGTSLEAKIKNYGAELFQDSRTEFTFVIQPQADGALQNMQARKNILLIIREILNNSLKHSQASKMTLHIYLRDKCWVMEINDNGIGMDMDKKNEGNGLINIRQRCAKLNGEMNVTGNNGTRYTFVFPIHLISSTG